MTAFRIASQGTRQYRVGSNIAKGEGGKGGWVELGPTRQAPYKNHGVQGVERVPVWLMNYNTVSTVCRRVCLCDIAKFGRGHKIGHLVIWIRNRIPGSTITNLHHKDQTAESWAPPLNQLPKGAGGDAQRERTSH